MIDLVTKCLFLCSLLVRPPSSTSHMSSGITVACTSRTIARANSGIRRVHVAGVKHPFGFEVLSSVDRTVEVDDNIGKTLGADDFIVMQK